MACISIHATKAPSIYSLPQLSANGTVCVPRGECGRAQGHDRGDRTEPVRHVPLRRPAACACLRSGSDHRPANHTERRDGHRHVSHCHELVKRRRSIPHNNEHREDHE